MYSNINFLKERARIQELELIRDRKIAFGTSIALGVLFTIGIALLLYSLFLSTKLNQIRSDTDTQKQQLASLSNIQSEYTQVRTIIGSVSSIYKNRTKKWDAIAYFYQILPANTIIHDVALDANSLTLTFSVEANSIFDVAALLNLLESDTVIKGGYTPTLGALTRADNGKYTQSVILHIGQAATPAPVKPVILNKGT